MLVEGTAVCSSLGMILTCSPFLLFIVAMSDEFKNVHEKVFLKKPNRNGHVSSLELNIVFISIAIFFLITNEQKCNIFVIHLLQFY